MKCHACGGRMSMVPYTHRTRLAGTTVEDSGQSAEACSSCGEVSLTTEQLYELERRAARKVLCEAKEVDGEWLTFARKSCGLRQPELAAALEITGPHMKQLEHRQSLPMRIRLAMVALIDRADGLHPKLGIRLLEESKGTK